MSLLACVVLDGCRRRTFNTSVRSHKEATRSDDPAFAPNRTDFDAIFGRSATTGDADIPPWPFLASHAGVTADANEVSARAKGLIEKGGVWKHIARTATELGLEAELGGVSAARVIQHAYLATLREKGDLRVSPFRLEGHFDDLFPFYDTELAISTEGDASAARRLQERLDSTIGRLARVKVTPRGPALEAALLGEPRVSLTRPAVEISSKLLEVLKEERLPAGDSAPRSPAETLRVLSALAVLRLQPEEGLVRQLREALARLPSWYAGLAGMEKDEVYLDLTQMFLEAGDLRRFFATLRAVDPGGLLGLRPSFPGQGKIDLSVFRNKEPLPIETGLMGPFTPFNGLRFSKVKALDVLTHSTESFDALKSITLNPTGTPNFYLSRKKPGSHGHHDYPGEIARGGTGVYTLPGAGAFYEDFRYAVSLIQHPRVGRRSQPDNYFRDTEYRVTNGAETYVHVPRYEPKPVEFFEAVLAGSTPPRSQLVHERKLLLDLSFEPSLREAASRIDAMAQKVADQGQPARYFVPLYSRLAKTTPARASFEKRLGERYAKAVAGQPSVRVLISELTQLALSPRPEEFPDVWKAVFAPERVGKPLPKQGDENDYFTGELLGRHNFWRHAWFFELACASERIQEDFRKNVFLVRDAEQVKHYGLDTSKCRNM